MLICRCSFLAISSHHPSFTHPPPTRALCVWLARALTLYACIMCLYAWTMGTQMVEAYPFVNPLPNPILTNAETGTVGNSFFIGKGNA